MYCQAFLFVCLLFFICLFCFEKLDISCVYTFMDLYNKAMRLSNYTGQWDDTCYRKCIDVVEERVLATVYRRRRAFRGNKHLKMLFDITCYYEEAIDQ